MSKYTYQPGFESGIVVKRFIVHCSSNLPGGMAIGNQNIENGRSVKTSTLSIHGSLTIRKLHIKKIRLAVSGGALESDRVRSSSGTLRPVAENE